MEWIYAQISSESYVPWSSPEARTESSKIDSERSCPAGGTLYRHRMLIRTWQGQSLLALGSALDTPPRYRWERPSPRAAYWRANCDTPQTERAQPAQTDSTRRNKSTHPHCVGTSCGRTPPNT